jgi:hypothetical protein
LIPKLSKVNAGRSQVAGEIALSDPVAPIHDQHAWLTIGIKPHEPEERVQVILGRKPMRSSAALTSSLL